MKLADILTNILAKQPWLFYVLCLVVFLFGGLFQPGDWYAQLNRAPWSPPNIAFPIAWTILYVMIAVAGHRISSTGDRTLLTLWFVQLAFNAAWSWIFFGQHWVLIGLLDLLLLILLVSAMMMRARHQAKQKQPKATTLIYLLAPYLGWLVLATSLNAYIFLNN